MFLFPKMLSSFEDSATAHLRKNSVQGIKRETTILYLCYAVIMLDKLRRREASFILKLKIERSGAERKYNFDCQLLFNETGSRSTILLYTPTLHCINIYLQYFFSSIFIKIDKVGLRRLEKDKKKSSLIPSYFLSLPSQQMKSTLLNYHHSIFVITAEMLFFFEYHFVI